jgi:hypothetical protein
VSDLGRFDMGQQVTWVPGGITNVTIPIDGVAILFSFDPGDGPEYLRVDYLSVELDFAITDLDAAGVIMLRVGSGGTDVPIISTSIGGPTYENRLRQCTQMALPLYISQVVAFRVEGHSSGTTLSSVSATIGISTAYAPPL